MGGKYDRAIVNRKAADAARKLQQSEREAREEAAKEAERQRERADAAVWKAEYAYEVLRAIMEDLRAGRRVAKPALTQAFHRLEGIPDHIRKTLLPPDNRLDVELRKDDPNQS